MTQEDVKSIIANASLEIQLTENGKEYITHFYKIEHLLTGLTILNFSISNFADYITQVFSPADQLDSPTFFNVIEEGADGEVYVFTILTLAMVSAINHQSLFVSEDDKELLHLVSLEEFFSPDTNK
jgi:hypothetical protein